jgi:predicted RNA binding protein YcfA (HicA-like mRNA interferase family)
VRSADVISIIKRAGWYLARVKGSHHHFRHGLHPGIVTVPHPRNDIPKGTLRSIEQQSGCKLL